MTSLLFTILLSLPGGLGGGGNINADEIAGIGLGAAALVGAIGYLILRSRAKKD